MGLTCERLGDVIEDFSLKNARRLSDVIACQGVNLFKIVDIIETVSANNPRVQKFHNSRLT